MIQDVEPAESPPDLSLPLLALLFVVIAFAFTWAIHRRFRQGLDLNTRNGRLIYRVGLFGPLIAAICVSSAGGRDSPVLPGWLWAGVTKWDVGWWWIPSIFTVPLLMVLGQLIARGGLRGVFHAPQQGWGSLVTGQVVVVIAEEVGWRGFALPLFMVLLGPNGGTLAVGILWAAWHLPMFGVAGSMQRGSFGDYALNLTALSFIMTCIYIGSGDSILLMMVFHAVFNICAYTMNLSEKGERYSLRLIYVSAIAIALFLPNRGHWTPTVPPASKRFMPIGSV